VSAADPKQLDELSYLVSNNTKREITAFSIAKTLVYEENGLTQEFTMTESADFMLHADFADVSKVKSISPGRFETMDSSGPISFGDSTKIKEVRLKVSYVEFSGNGAFGLGTDGQQQISASRDGASRYKAWLVQQYQQSGKSLSGVLDLLQRDDVPQELGSMDISQMLGAKRYRMRLLKIFQTEGSASVEERLIH
jgi:hypothetical protein